MYPVRFTRLICLTVVVSLTGYAVSNPAWGQNPPGARADSKTQDQANAAKTATLRGKVVVPDKWKSAVKPDELAMRLTEHVQMEQPPIPENWNELAPEAQGKWWEDFQNSDKGRQFIAVQEERFRNRKQFDIRVAPAGDFSVFDVPPGIWDLSASVTRQADPYEMLFEVSGELEIEEEVEEVMLGEMTVTATPIFREGDQAPDVELQVGGKPVRLSSYRGQHVLLTFWSAGFPTSGFFQKNVQAVATTVGKNHPLQLVSIALDQDADAEKQFFAENGQAGVYAPATLSDSIVEELGVRLIPWLMLISPEGKIMMSDQALGIALRTSGLELGEIVSRRIEGREIPGPPPTDAGK